MLFALTVCGTGDRTLAVYHDAGVNCLDRSTIPPGEAYCNGILIFDAGQPSNPCQYPDGGWGVWKSDNSGNFWCVGINDNP